MRTNRWVPFVLLLAGTAGADDARLPSRVAEGRFVRGGVEYTIRDAKARARSLSPLVR